MHFKHADSQGRLTLGKTFVEQHVEYAIQCDEATGVVTLTPVAINEIPEGSAVEEIQERWNLEVREIIDGEPQRTWKEVNMIMGLKSDEESVRQEVWAAYHRLEAGAPTHSMSEIDALIDPEILAEIEAEVDAEMDH